MSKSAQPVGPRTALLYVAMFVCAAALLATSAPPWWAVEQAQRVPVTFEAEQPSRITSEAVVLYRAPKGRWPLTLSAWVAAGLHATFPSAKLRWSVDSHDSFATDLQPEQAGVTGSKKFEIECDDKLCEGMLTIALTIDYVGGPIAADDAGSQLPGDAGDTDDQRAGDAGEAGDAGTGAPSGDELRVEASFKGGIDEDPLWSCQRKDSSTDSENPPKQLGLELTLAPLTYDMSAPAIPRAQSDAAVLTPTGMRVDAGQAWLDAGR
jgi:hypothetical protein